MHRKLGSFSGKRYGFVTPERSPGESYQRPSASADGGPRVQWYDIVINDESLLPTRKTAQSSQAVAQNPRSDPGRLPQK